MIGRVNTGGGKGADMTVTAPAGSTVTVSKDGKTLTRVAGADGIVIFRGLETGTWTLTSTDGEQTASKMVEIVADYATSITFFAATINVTYPAGSTCTATDGTTTITAPDTSGTWACVVPNAGTWTVSITNNAGTKSKSVAITSNGQTESCVLGAPSDYQEVVYLESTGTQYIDSGLTGKTYRYRVTAKVIPSSTGTLFGETIEQPYVALLGVSGTDLVPSLTYNGNAVGSALTLNATYNLDKRCTEDGVLTITNNRDVIATYNYNTSVNNERSASPFIFCRRRRTSGELTGDFIKAKLYTMEIYDIDNTTLLREFVPCYRKSDSVAGLYDLVNGVFYTNAGSGHFVVGGDV